MNRNLPVILLTLIFAVSIWFHLAPPRWWLNLTKPVDLTHPVEAGEKVVEKYNCRNCHNIGGEGAAYAPTLAHVTERLDPLVLRLQIRNPKLVHPESKMPNFKLSDPEIEAVFAYLSALDAYSAP